MNAIFSLYKDFTNLILSGEKDLEFRNKNIKVNKGDKIYMYETKKNGGRGKVVGYFVVEEMVEIPKHKLGCYNFLLHYAIKKGLKEETISQIKKALSIDLECYDNSIVTNYLFDEEYLNFLIENKRPMTFNESFERSLKDPSFYNKLSKRSDDYCKEVDAWLSKIGFYNQYDESTWKYYIKISSYKKFEKPLNISDFRLINGECLKVAPQSFCYTLTNI